MQITTFRRTNKGRVTTTAVATLMVALAIGSGMAAAAGSPAFIAPVETKLEEGTAAFNSLMAVGAALVLGIMTVTGYFKGQLKGALVGFGSGIVVIVVVLVVSPLAVEWAATATGG